MIAALIDLQVGAASEGYLYLDKNLAWLQARNRHLLDFNVLFAIEDGSLHGSVQAFPFPVKHQCAAAVNPGCITTFIESGFGFEARCSASTASLNGKRCEIRPSRSISRLNTSRAL